MLACKETVSNKVLHSTTSSSSHTHNLLLHFHASPPTSHPKSFICATVNNLFSDKSNNLRKRTIRGTSPTHLSNQNKVFNPFPILRLTLSAYQLLNASPQPSRILTISLHQTDPSHPPACKRPPSRPYLTAKILNHMPSLSVTYLQHHFPNNATLNSLSLLTPKPRTPLSKQTQTVSQSIQEIFLLYSHPPQKNEVKEKR